MGDQNAAFLQSRIPPNKKQISGRRFRPTTVLRLRSHRFYWEHNCQVVIFLIHSFPSITPPPPTHPPQSEIKRHSWIKQSVGDWLESYILSFPESRTKVVMTHTHTQRKKIYSFPSRKAALKQRLPESVRKNKKKVMCSFKSNPFFLHEALQSEIHHKVHPS